MSNNLSKLAKQFEGDTCAKFDELLAQKDDEKKPDPVVVLARAWNAGKIALCDIEEGELRKAVKAAALTL
jgi:hypothetical protein